MSRNKGGQQAVLELDEFEDVESGDSGDVVGMERRDTDRGNNEADESAAFDASTEQFMFYNQKHQQ